MLAIARQRAAASASESDGRSAKPFLVPLSSMRMRASKPLARGRSSPVAGRGMATSSAPSSSCARVGAVRSSSAARARPAATRPPAFRPARGHAGAARRACRSRSRACLPARALAGLLLPRGALGGGALGDRLRGRLLCLGLVEDVEEQLAEAVERCHGFVRCRRITAVSSALQYASSRKPRRSSSASASKHSAQRASCRSPL